MGGADPAAAVFSVALEKSGENVPCTRTLKKRSAKTVKAKEFYGIAVYGM
jgi:hypothetical protein